MMMNIAYGVGGYLIVGLIVTSCIWLYYRKHGSGSDLFNPFPEWVLFLLATVAFPLNLYLQWRAWRYTRQERKKRLEAYRKSQGMIN